MKKHIRLKSSLHPEFSSTIQLGDEKYIATTDISSGKGSSLTTTIYLKGAIVSTIKNDCEVELSSVDKKELKELIGRYHRKAVDAFKEEHAKINKNPSDYIEEAKVLLDGNNGKNALDLLSHAIKQHPEEPVLLSYYGYLMSSIEGNHSVGVSSCIRAIRIINKSYSIGQKDNLSAIYLNLGKTYVAAGNRKSAIDILNKGLSADSGNRDLQNELNKLGTRKKSIIPFLSRSNPINKYLGKLIRNK